MDWREYALVEVVAIVLCSAAGIAGGAWFSGKISLWLYCGAFVLAGLCALACLWLAERQNQRHMREIEAKLRVIEALRPWAETVIVRGTLMQLQAYAEDERTLQ